MFHLTKGNIAIPLENLSNITFTSLANGDVLRYNGSIWINDPLNLGTDTAGNYVEDVTAGNGLTKSSSAGEGQTVDLAVSVDDSSIEINSDSLRVKASGITSAMLAGSIANSKLANSTVSFGGVSLALGATDATPAFDLSDATNYPTSSLSGTITNAQLSGSIANSKLANSTVSFGGISVALGASDATPAFDLSDATNYPTSSLSGTITNAQLAGSIANSKLANSSITVTDGSNSTATALGGTITFSGTNNEITVGESSGTITISLPDDVTIGQNLTVTGNLDVNGTTTTIDTTNTTVTDSLIELANGTSGSPSNDSGLVIERGSADNAFIGFDESEDKFIVGTGSFTGASTGNLTISTGTLVANIEGNVSGTSGSTTGNAATATKLATARAIAGQSFDGTAAITIASTDLSDTANILLTTNTKTLTNKTINLESNTVIVEYVVTVAGGKFVIDGESQATISFRPGVVHRFDLSHSTTSSHPFVLSTTSEGTAYTTGRTANGSQGSSGAYIEFTVDASTPDILYYYCSSHSGMGGTITVFGSAYGDADVQSYLSAGTGITLSGSGQISSSITQYADSDVQSYLSAGTGIALSGSGEISSTITQYANSDVQSYLSGGNGITMSGSGAFSVDATAITGQTALSGSVDTGNDLVLLYDNSATALKKVDVSTLLASAGAGNMNSFTLTGDSGSNQTVADGNTVDIAGGTGIDTVASATDMVTVNIDSSVATLTGHNPINKTLLAQY